jgi:hypothetical protein
VAEVIALLQALADKPWLFVILLLAWLIYKTDLVKLYLSGRKSEREVLNEQQQELVEGFREQLEDFRQRFDGDRRAWAEERLRLEHALAEALRDAGRWRHFAMNLGSYIFALERKLSQAGLEVPHFDWGDMLRRSGLGDEAAVRMANSLGEPET